MVNKYKVNKIARSNLGTGRVATNASADPTHHPKPQLRRFTHFLTASSQTPHWLQLDAPQNYPLLIPTTCLIRGPIRPAIPNRIHIQSAVLPQYTGQTDERTDRHTDQQMIGGSVDDYRPLWLYRELRGLIINFRSVRDCA